MQDSRPETLRAALSSARVPDRSSLSDGCIRISFTDMQSGSCLGKAVANLSGKTVLVAVSTQVEAALALVELDGICRRLVLLPPGTELLHLPAIIRDAGVDGIVCSNTSEFAHYGVASVHQCSLELVPGSERPERQLTTEWLMLTSGTTGDPKIAVHTLAGLTGAITPASPDVVRPTWATFYDIRRYGGLQIFLRAVFSGGSLVVSRPGEAIADHLGRLKDEGVTHISGTPTHWRKALMSPAIKDFMPEYVRLSGEIADQSILDALHIAFPHASIGHAYASTEAGVGFDVNDGLEGFPQSYLDAPRNGVEMRIVDGSLRIRSTRMASHYAGRPDLSMTDTDGWVDSGDMVELRNGRCHFTGRRGGIINVGGLKVHPEEVETVINRHVAVRQSRVKPRKSPVIGAIVVADVVLHEGKGEIEVVKQDILTLCRAILPAHKIPAIVNVVSAIEMTSGGKVSRQYA